jgi:hypothetical protein
MLEKYYKLRKREASETKIVAHPQQKAVFQAFFEQVKLYLSAYFCESVLCANGDFFAFL